MFYQVAMCVGTLAFLAEKQPHSGGGPSLLSLLQQDQPQLDSCCMSEEGPDWTKM